MYVYTPGLMNKSINWQEFLIQTLTGTKTIPEQILKDVRKYCFIVSMTDVELIGRMF